MLQDMLNCAQPVHRVRSQMSNANFSLNIVMALHSEAIPIIEYFHLKKITHVNLPFTLFVNKDKSIHLILSGIGKVKIASATTFLHMWTGNKNHTCFLNIGIAGSKQHTIGDGVLIHKVIDKSTNKCWFPFVSRLKIKNQATLFTHDLPQTSYPSNGIVDMEGSAFFETAIHFVTQEQVQLYKIISDMDEKTMHEITKEKVKQLISTNITTISELANNLISLSIEENKLDQPDFLETFQATWHFTHSQLLQLKQCLKRWRIQIKDQDALLHCRDEKTASHVLSKLVEKLDEHCLY